MVKYIEYKDFKLPNNVDKIKIISVSNGLNSFSYKGTKLHSSILPIVIPIEDLKNKQLQFDIKGSSTNLSAIIDKYQKEGWYIKDIKDGFTIFAKDGFNDIRVYRGDIRDNVITYQYSRKNSLMYSEDCTLTVHHSINKSPEYITSVIRESYEVSDSFTIRLKDFFKDAHSYKVSFKSNKYFELNSPSECSIDVPIKVSYSPFTEEVNRIIVEERKKGYGYLTKSDKILYFSKGFDVREIPFPSPLRSILEVQVSKDGINYSNNGSIVLIPQSEYVDRNKFIISVPEGGRERTILVGRANLLFIPSGGNISTIEYD